MSIPTSFDLALIDATDANYDALYSVSIDTLVQKERVDLGPFTLTLNRFYPNTYINQRGIVNKKYEQMGYDFKLISLPKTYKMDEKNIPGIDIHIHHSDTIIGQFILWGGSAIYQELDAGNAPYLLALRPKRRYLPFQVQLHDFVKSNYDRSDIAKTYSSDVSVISEHGAFPFTISMNNPLRHKGYTFFQASFSEDESMSVFQVVQNPSWLIPYISSLLIVIGLLIQMIQSMKKARS